MLSASPRRAPARTRPARAALGLALLAAVGCTTPYRPGSPYYIEDVTVTVAPGSISPAAAASIERDIEAVAARAPREGAPKRLDVTVNSFRTKNAGMSLLVGDSNSMAGTASIVGAGTGTTEWSEEVAVISDVFVQGIAGAIIAAARTREGVEAQLSQRFAATVSRLAYGGTLPTGAPRRTPPAPAPARAPTPAPAVEQPVGTSGVVAGV